MAKITGVVSGVQDGKPNEKTGEVTKFVSIEGISTILDAKVTTPPVQGQEIVARVSVRWRKDKRPVHILSEYVPVALAP